MPAPESPLALTRRARRIERVLAETYPDARCELDFDDPFQLLVVTVLSAQTTDKRVNAVRPTLFAAYPDARAMAAAPEEWSDELKAAIVRAGWDLDDFTEGIRQRQAAGSNVTDLSQIIIDLTTSVEESSWGQVKKDVSEGEKYAGGRVSLVHFLRELLQVPR